jgi:hypothetical protein
LLRIFKWQPQAFGGPGVDRNEKSPGFNMLFPVSRWYVGVKLILRLTLAAACIIAACGCSRKTADQPDYLIKVRSSLVTVAEFNRAVANASEEVFPGEIKLEESALQELRVRVLKQLTEELIIVERAKELKLRVSPEELQEAVDGIKAEYPGNTFEETLLENAVSFEEWKKKLAVRLLVQKVITAELIDQVQITTQDVADYYRKYYPKGLPQDEDAAYINERIVKHLRQQKAEQLYKDWINQLRQSIPVQINEEKWNGILENEKAE